MHRSTQRRGMLIPAIAIAILVAASITALVLNRLYLDTARSELQVATEAAALAAANGLIVDARLQPQPDWNDILEAARESAARTGSENRAAGQPLTISDEPDRHLRFGRLVRNPRTGRQRFVQVRQAPEIVRALGERTRASGNPVDLLIRFWNGPASADMRTVATVTVRDDVVGLRPFKNVSAPVWPFAVAIESASQIFGAEDSHSENRSTVTDNFTWDLTTPEIRGEPDGLAELWLSFPSNSSISSQANTVPLKFGEGTSGDSFERQISKGVSRADLAAFDGELRIDGSLSIDTHYRLPDGMDERLREQIGQCRGLLLFAGEADSGGQPVDCTRLVAARLIDVRHQSGRTELLIQPGVLATRTALLESASADESQDPDRNRYIYKLYLTH